MGRLGVNVCRVGDRLGTVGPDVRVVSDFVAESREGEDVRVLVTLFCLGFSWLEVLVSFLSSVLDLVKRKMAVTRRLVNRLG